MLQPMQFLLIFADMNLTLTIPLLLLTFTLDLLCFMLSQFNYVLCLFNTYNAIQSVLPRLLAQSLPGYLNHNISLLIWIPNILFSFRLGRLLNPCPRFLTAAKGGGYSLKTTVAYAKDHWHGQSYRITTIYLILQTYYPYLMHSMIIYVIFILRLNRSYTHLYAKHLL